MASNLEEELSCAVCHDIFKNPVVLSCSHSFCRDCLQAWWREREVKECPVCKRRSSRSDPPRNLALKNLCEAFLVGREEKKDPAQPEKDPEALCDQHSEKLKLFCLDHQQPVCLVCRDSKIHRNHSFSPVDEVAKGLKKKLHKTLKPLQEKLKLLQIFEVNCDQTAEHIKLQARQTETQIRDQLKKLHQFLTEEEEARVSAVREEEQRKSGAVKDKMAALRREIETLSETVRATEEQLRDGDVSFLQKYKAAVDRVQQRLLLDDPNLPSGALLDEAKHLGNLSLNIWTKIKKKIPNYPVTLDPNTAHPYLLLSADLSSVCIGEEKQKLPDNPERFGTEFSVLGSKGFRSRTSSWDVKVGENSSWSLGVASKSFNKEGELRSKIWRIEFCNGKYKAFSPSKPPVALSVKKKLQKIRVNLDWWELFRFRLSFSDPDTGRHIYTFTYTSTEELFPYMSTGDKVLIKILPEEDEDEEEDDDEKEEEEEEE